MSLSRFGGNTDTHIFLFYTKNVFFNCITFGVDGAWSLNDGITQSAYISTDNQAQNLAIIPMICNHLRQYIVISHFL